MDAESCKTYDIPCGDEGFRTILVDGTGYIWQELEIIFMYGRDQPIVLFLLIFKVKWNG
jgi:hypothetical protein